MKFTLKDYQLDAVIQVLDNLERAKRKYHEDDAESSFALTATTGAGKTVMAAAAIEALFDGNSELDFEADPGAVVIWFSDDPNLNDQTRRRLMQASEKLGFERLVTIEYPFSRSKLTPGKVYFLNTGKLTSTSRLTLGAARAKAVEATGQASFVTPDELNWTIWDTLRNTIQDDELTVYLVIDEAHRGFGTRTSSDKSTIVKRLVDGDETGCPIPIVWGISATIENFRDAMVDASLVHAREQLPQILVDPVRVQASGLIKDAIVLDIPAEQGNLESALAVRAARKLKESARQWAAYAKAEGEKPGAKSSEAVIPLLIIQIPNTEDTDQVGSWLDVIATELGTLISSQIAHVLGDHSMKTFGSWEVDWIEPQSVQQTNEVRVLIAKEAISTGWDCPRAEVMLSFRPAKDHTHITQLLGRMVRTPLARRIPGDDILNSVDCILPHFDRTTAVSVTKYLTGLIEDVPGGARPKVLIDGRALAPNPSVPNAVWQLWDVLPSLRVPQRGARPVKQLMSLAQALAADGIQSNAIAGVEVRIHEKLEELASRHDAQLRSAEIEVRTVRGMTISGAFGGSKLSYRDFVEHADERTIRSAFEDAKRAFGADIAQSYVDLLAGPDDQEAEDDGLRAGYVKAIALATVPSVREQIDEVAKGIVDNFLKDHHDEIQQLSDERRGTYEDIRAQAVSPQVFQLQRPRTRLEDFSVEVDGVIGAAQVADRHLMSDKFGNFPLTNLNEWEKIVIRQELANPNCVAWYRNPSVSVDDSLGITYRDAVGNWRAMHPDFIFFSEKDGETTASIIDPHGTFLEDALVKLRGLALFAEKNGDSFDRIEAISEGSSGALKKLDLKREVVQKSILGGEMSASELFASQLAEEYA